MQNEICAYVGKCRKNGIGVEGIIGSSYDIVDFNGAVIGSATKGSTWRVKSYIGTHMTQFYARINGREYTGRSFGEGMAIRLRLTAEAKRKRAREAIS